MKPHKWAKEIKAWADGVEIEGKWQWAQKDSLASEWCVLESPDWDTEAWIYRIKPQPKEPQYLYVYFNKQHHDVEFVTQKYKPTPPTFLNYVGKIKLETDDE